MNCLLRQTLNILFILTTCGFHQVASAQDQDLIDSLEAIIQDPTMSDSLVAEAYKGIIRNLIEQADGEQPLEYLERLHRFSEEASYPDGMLKVYFYTAYYYYRRGKHDSVLVYTERLANLAEEMGRQREYAQALNRLAVTSYVIGQHEKSREYFEASQEISREIGNSMLQLSNNLGQATLEKTLGNHDLALAKYLAIDSMFGSEPERDHYRVGLALHNIGLTYLEFMEDSEKAMHYLERARDEYSLMNRQTGEIPSVNVEIARIHVQNGEYATADSLFSTSLQAFREIGHAKKIGETAMKYGTFKMDRDQFDEAESLLKEAESSYEDLQAPVSLSDVFHQLGMLYHHTGRNQEAIRYLDKALAQEIPEGQKQKSRRSLANVLSGQSEYQEAFQALDAYVSQQDSINEAELKEALQEMQIKYETSQKEQEILSLQYQQAQQRNRNQRNLLGSIGLLAVLGAMSFAFYYRARQRKRAHAKLQELDQLKSRLFANISHEFRTPLSLIKGPVDLVLRDDDVGDDVKQKLNVVQRNSVRLTQLIDSVSELARLDAGKVSLKVRAGDLTEHLRIIAASFESLAQSRGCTFNVSITADSEPRYYDPDIIETILYNLLSNAFKYAPEGTVELTYQYEADQASISVADDGPGLSEEDQQRVFDRYFRVENHQQQVEGIGIGLAVSHELAKLHHGHLSVKSELGKGSTFSLGFPVSASAYAATEISTGGAKPVQSRKVAVTAAAEPSEANLLPMHEDEQVILLAEDNPDMRAHLHQLFADEYRILLAKDGQEGVEMAKKFVPDLVISDLMMPHLNGMEFLRQLREDTKTSHIPFIMLTANRLEEAKLGSIYHGVDDFMTKPFSIDEIRLKVENLIRLRHQLREKFAETSVIDSTKLAANDTDKEFWNQVKAVINENLANAEFTTEDFAKAMYMSRMQLHRKLKALTGTSAASFMRTQRLQAAAQMLKNNNVRVTDIAFDLGFTSPFYFSKCFKEEFGVAPRDYAKQTGIIR